MSDVSLFDKVENLLAEILHRPYLETIDHIWYTTEDEVYWNEHDNLEDLQDSDGATYSGEIKGRKTVDEDCVFFNVDTGCGETMTYVFRKDKEVKFDE